ncbi:hypothetical protein L596_008463 [Steinernema carpocapsae]|uniref:Uncharacterized protein n=1 Tax=Steinernema carpocapsae TaxID=34508 RepID=A0A4U5PCU6_STECR|nr:hypothetical protein L596_008463 [Steinernema carpocapsae]
MASVKLTCEKELDVAKLVLLVFNSLVVLTVILVSLRMRRRHLYKIYTIALFSAYFPAHVAHPIVLLIYGEQDCGEEKLLEWPERLYKILVDFSHSQYEMNSLIFLSLAFLMYSKLNFTSKILAEKNFSFLFAGSYGVIFFVVTVQTILDGIYNRYHGQYRWFERPITLEAFWKAFSIALQLLRAVPYALVWVMMILSIGKLIWDKPKRQISDKRAYAKNRKLLISAICFLAFPQILHFPPVAHGLLEVYKLFISKNRTQISIGELMNSLFIISFHAKQFRVIFLSICVVLFFPPYRTLLFPCRIHNVSVVSMDTITLSHPSFCQCTSCATDIQQRTTS